MRKINVGIIGFGLSGKVFHGPLISSTEEMEIVKILSSKSDEIKSIYPEVTVVNDILEIINDESIDLVINCGPNSVHYSYTKIALENNKHVIVEKPFVTSIDEGKELIQLAKSKDLLLSVFHNRRLDSDFLTIKKLIHEEKLGELKLFESHFDRYRPTTRDNRWRERKGVGNGILYDLGPHLIDQALNLFGEPISLLADICVQKIDGEVTDYFHIIMKYKNNFRVILHGNSFGDTAPRFRVEGAKSSFVKYGMDPQENQLRLGIFPENKLYGQEEKSNFGILYSWHDDNRLEEIVESVRGNYLKFYKNIVDVIYKRTNEKILVTAESALRVIELIEIAYSSSREEREIII